jgi:hypothetical protein
MAETTKITLSPYELELVCNTEWILTKHRIVDKVYQIFGESVTQMELAVARESDLPPIAREQNAKISKGENYGKLPYVMLDYPRHFSRESTLAVRTFFWWGNFFSLNLQLGGTYKDKFAPGLVDQWNFLQEQQYWICVHADPWQHHFDSSNYKQVNSLSQQEFAAILERESFVKIAKKCPLSHWDTVPGFIESTFKEMIKLLKA